MLKALFLLIIISSSHSFAADIKNWTYIDENNMAASLSLYDKANVSGEEMVTWITSDGSVQMAKPATASNLNVEIPVFVQSDDGEILYDLNLGISMGTSFTQVKSMLKDISYRQAFEYLPETCSDKDTAFLVVVNNVESTMFGYCLTPKN
ncbi:MAG: hypothetical protein KDD38_00135 [Bdellovibrionales bacterium]|nr:hypothetical protein [Bdellovibrionales bacterium]